MQIMEMKWNGDGPLEKKKRVNLSGNRVMYKASLFLRVFIMNGYFVMSSVYYLSCFFFCFLFFVFWLNPDVFCFNVAFSCDSVSIDLM